MANVILFQPLPKLKDEWPKRFKLQSYVCVCVYVVIKWKVGDATRKRNDVMIYLISLTSNPGGKVRRNFSALSWSVNTKVYRYLEHRTLNLMLFLFFLIMTDLAPGRRTDCMKSLISLICFGILLLVVWVGGFDFEWQIRRETVNTRIEREKSHS